MALLLSILKDGGASSRRYGTWLTVAELEDWPGRLLLAAENDLRARPKDAAAFKVEHISRTLAMKESCPVEAGW